MNPVAMTGTGRRRHRKVWKWIGLSALFSVIVLAIVVEVLVKRAAPILKGRVIETLSTRFNSKVELDTLRVQVGKGLSITGGGLRIFPTDEVIAAGATQPLIAVKEFSFETGLLGLLLKPMHVSSVKVNGVAIHIPPSSMRTSAAHGERHGGKTKIQVDRIECSDSVLVIDTDKPNKEPKRFDLEYILMRDLGPNTSWPYEAKLTNAVPEGQIHAVGEFGPWNTEVPGASPVNGHYSFQNANLTPIKGIGGVLTSVGDFKGQLNRIDVIGAAEVPAFTLDTAKSPMPLHTEFHAIVDGTSGDTYLEPVKAKLGRSSFTCRGSVVNVKGKGHVIDLDVDIPAGEIEDFLRLAVKTTPAVMTGVITTRAKLHIRPGKEPVAEKLSMRGRFRLRRIHFTNTKVQEKVDIFSLRAQGEPDKIGVGSEDVRSEMTGEFTMGRGKVTLQQLAYEMPGATVRLAGVYSMDGKQFDFTGKLRTKAKLSQMVKSFWRSLLLKPVDPFFAKNGAGAEIPVKISGTESAPKFGLNFGKK